VTRKREERRRRREREKRKKSTPFPNVAVADPESLEHDGDRRREREQEQRELCGPGAVGEVTTAATAADRTEEQLQRGRAESQGPANLRHAAGRGEP